MLVVLLVLQLLLNVAPMNAVQAAEDKKLYSSWTRATRSACEAGIQQLCQKSATNYSQKTQIRISRNNAKTSVEAKLSIARAHVKQIKHELLQAQTALVKAQAEESTALAFQRRVCAKNYRARNYFVPSKQRAKYNANVQSTPSEIREQRKKNKRNKFTSFFGSLFGLKP